MAFNYASRYRLRNKFTNNLITQSGGWDQTAGLHVYGGSDVSDDQIWYFLSVRPESFRINNLRWPGWFIASSSSDVAFVSQSIDSGDQYWKVKVIQDDNTYLYITSTQSGLALRDLNAPGTSGVLSLASVVEEDARAQWCLVAI